MNSDIYKEMIKMEMTPEILSIRFERSPELIEEWLAGVKEPPAYWLLAMKAVRKYLPPADNIAMRKPLDLCTYIGAPRETVPYWLRTGQFPIMARYAVSYVMHSTSPKLTPGDVRTIRKLYSGYYYRVGPWYTSKPVMDKVLSRIKPGNVEKLLARGYAYRKTNGVIELTSKGMKYLEEVK